MFYDYEKKFKFKTSISTKGFPNKPQGKEVSQIEFTEHSVSVPELLNYIKEGRPFCNVFKHTEDTFSISQKSETNFVGSYLIFLDIDNSNIPLMKYVNSLSIKPTFSFSSFRNHIHECNYVFKFKLFYVFDTEIKDPDYFRHLYNSIVEKNNLTIEDNCGRSPSQFSNGTIPSCDSDITNIIYSFTDFPEYKPTEKTPHEKKEGKSKINITVVDTNFIESLRNKTPYFEIVKQYKNRYNYFDHTELEFNTEGYALVPENYLTIYRKWYVGTFQKNNGEYSKFCAIHRSIDGEMRRKKLFLAALIMRKIKPNISFENLLFNLVCEVDRYYNNSDRQLNPDTLISIAQTVVSKDISEIVIKSNGKRKPPKFVIDKTYCSLNGKKPKEYKQEVGKKLSYNEIYNLYDCNISPKENLVILKEFGIKVSIRKLYEFCKEKKINTNPKHQNIKNIYDINLPFKTNFEIINKAGFKVSVRTLRSILKEFNITSNNRRVQDFAITTIREKSNTINIVVPANNCTHKKTLQQIAKKELNIKKDMITDEVIGNVYDCSASLVDNWKYIRKELEMKGATKRRLYDFCTRHQIDVNPNIQIPTSESLSHNEILDKHVKLEFDKQIAEMQLKYNNMNTPTEPPKIYTDVIKIDNPETTEVYDDDDIQISHQIIKGYHKKLLDLKEANLEYNVIMTLINSYMYYIAENAKCLPQEEAIQTLNVCGNISQKIEARFN
ncbi:hypothetical protein EZS27_018240 [termite gut metagenome]|uniref:Uncharacterized protein n=1 Tax=termite gut metagenome TaxID=433724 RepID=A0A5J4RH38_9ZZZZ